MPSAVQLWKGNSCYSQAVTHPRHSDHVTHEQVSLLRAKTASSNHNNCAVIVLKAGLLLKLRLLSWVICLSNCCVCFLTACTIYCINVVVFTVGTRFFCKTNTCEQTWPPEAPTATVGARLKNHPGSAPSPSLTGTVVERATFLPHPGKPVREVWRSESHGHHSPSHSTPTDRWRGTPLQGTVRKKEERDRRVGC